MLPQNLRINFQDISYGNQFHQCVYILCNQEQPLMQAAALARQHFQMGEAAPYMPHLSLLYGDLDNQAKHAAMQQAVQRLYGEGSNYDTLLPDNGFTVDKLSLWYTPIDDRSLSSWVKVADMPLPG